jgi:hypothetical protein
MKIELFGLPGAGKTTFARRLAEEDGVPLVHVNERKEMYVRVGRFFLRHPLLVLRLLACCVQGVRGNMPLLKYKLLSLLLPALAREEKSNDFSACIIDEGMLQMLLSAHEERIAPRNLRPFEAFLKARTVEVYCIEAQPQERYERMRQRNGAPRQRFGTAYLARWQPICEANYEIIRDFVSAHLPHRRIYRVNGPEQRFKLCNRGRKSMLKGF